MTTFDQRLVEEINKLNGSWPWGNLLLCAIALILCIVFLFLLSIFIALFLYKEYIY